MEENESLRNKTQEYYDKIKLIHEKLELTDKQQIIGINEVDNIKLGGCLERNSVIAVKIKDEDGTIHHVIIDKNINKIATIDKEGKIELSEREQKLWESRIGRKGEQRPDQKKLYDFDKEYFVEEYKTEELNKEKEEKQKEKKDNKDNKEKEAEEGKNEKHKEEKEVAKALNVEEETIKCIVKIEDRDTFGQAINRDLKADTYIVQHGNNKIKIMQTSTGNLGDLKEVAGLEQSEFVSEVLEQLNMPTQGNDLKIKAGDLKTIKDEESGCRYIVVRENDPDKGVVIVSSPTGVQTYIFDDRNRDSLEELEESIEYRLETGKDEIEEEEDKGRSRDDEAYERRFGHY